MTKQLLIIEDDESLNQMLQFHFEDQGYQVVGVDNCTLGLQRIRGTAFDLLLLDQQLPDGQGIDLLQQIHSEIPELSVIMMTGQHDLELATVAANLCPDHRVVAGPGDQKWCG